MCVLKSDTWDVHHLQNKESLPLLTVPCRRWHDWRLAATRDWIAFRYRYCTGSLHINNWCVYSTIWKNAIISGPFAVSIINAYSEWIWCMETLKTNHVYLFEHGRVWRDCLRDMRHHSTFFSWNYFLLLSFNTKYTTSNVDEKFFGRDIIMTICPWLQ